MFFTGQNPHFLLTQLWIVQVNPRKSSGETCCCVFQDAVQHNENIMHGLWSQFVLEKQFFCKIINQCSRHAHILMAATSMPCF